METTPPSQVWLAASPLPPLTGTAGRAERLILHVHYSADFTVWGSRLERYWDALTDNVRGATYRGRDLPGWWEHITATMGSNPRTPEERQEVTELLYAGDDIAVLNDLRAHTAALVLRARVTSEHYRAQRTPKDTL
jgi:hypothetical protein